MSSGGSVTNWLRQLKAGDEACLGALYQRYRAFLIGLARKKVKNAPRRAADEEDVAQEAFWAFCRSFRGGSPPILVDRNSLLALLTVITAHEAISQMERERRAKRGGGRVRGESVLESLAGPACHARGTGRTPQEEAILRDFYQHYLTGLPQNLREFAELYLAGYTYREISEQIGCAERTVERKMPIILKRWQQMAKESVSSGEV
jgi:RNA polymerase sigma factor (sigma-70 family)